MAEIPFSTVLAALDNTERPFPAKYLERFSDLAPADLKALQAIWPRLPLPRKHLLLKKLVETFEAETIYSFETLAASLLDDEDGQVRIYALRLLAETADVRLLPRLLQLLQTDPEPASRAAAATLLGQFVQLGELEEISAAHLDQAVTGLLKAATDPDSHLARAALQSLGYASRPEVETLIENAFQHHDPRWQAAALVAAGRSADVARWQEAVIEGFSSEDQPVRLTAVQAAGDLSLKPARQALLNMIDDEEDDEVLQAIIWSLSLIGGEDVREYLQTLIDDTDDDEMLEFLEEALMNLSFTEDAEDFNLLALDEDEPVVKKKKR